MNKPDGKRPRDPRESYSGRMTELMTRLMDIADEKEARAVIGALAPEESGLYKFLLKTWRDGYVTF